jgi:oligopeptide/dipeptide ABC transporter ATP-binding protein
MTGLPLLSVRDLRVSYRTRRGLLRRGPDRVVQALAGVDLDVAAGETLALVGESGSGKSTLGRAMIRLVEPSGGAVRFRDTDITALDRHQLRPLRRHFQIVFQDPFGSLNPRMTIGRAIAEPVRVHGALRGRALDERVAECLALVGLDPAVAARHPHAFSGGQRQRIAIARAIACGPDFIVADEPLSALDMSLQGQIIDLFLDLKRRLGLTYLFISHDLNVVRTIADRVAVMYLGKLVELAPTASLYARPAHPYTRALLSAVPSPDPVAERARVYTPLAGDPPSPAEPPPGCRFHTRCPLAIDRCRSVEPEVRNVAPGHAVACHLAE